MGKHAGKSSHPDFDQLGVSAQYNRKQQSGNQNRGYDIPALSIARAEFESFIGGALQWPL